MKAIKITVNGKVVCTAGRDGYLNLSACIFMDGVNNHFSLNAGSSTYTTKDNGKKTHLEQYWEMPVINVGDNVELEVVTTDNPTQPTHEFPTGVKIGPPIGNEKVCSFCSCGEDSEHVDILFEDARGVNICSSCINFYSDNLKSLGY